jgi:pimeloyl-ACP methyl ester carboxylesterase
MQRVRGIIATTSAIGYEACVNAIKGNDMLGRLGTPKMPVHLVAGAQDGAAPPALMQAMADAIPDAKLTVLEPCGHLSSIQRPSELTALIQSFCTGA